MSRTISRFWKAIRPIVLSIRAILTVVIESILTYRLVVDVQQRLCISTVLNSNQSKLVFEKYQPETDNAIYIMTSDGKLECRLSGDYYSDDFPVWSPDGRHIAFKSMYPLDGIFVMNTDGTDRRLIAGGQLNFYYGRPTWSPDSKSLAFSKISTIDDSSKIYIASIEGNNQSRILTDAGFGDNYPAWSPDGKRIAFDIAQVRSSLGDIYVINIDGSNEQRLTQNEGSGPTWSPDGQQIAFTAPYDSQFNLFIMNADGTNMHRLTIDESGTDNPVWSPNGRQIAFYNGGSIYVVNIDGSGLQRLTKPNDSQIDRSPSWSGLNP